MNYCLLWDEVCPDHSQCGSAGPADYRCLCQSPYTTAQDGQCGLNLTPASSDSTHQKIVKNKVMEENHVQKQGSYVYTDPKNDGENGKHAYMYGKEVEVSGSKLDWNILR